MDRSTRLYGPMALFVFMVLVGLRVARTSTGLTAAHKKVQTFAYALVWLSVFLFAGLITVAWWRVNFPDEFVVSGTIHTLTDPESIYTDQELYLHRHILAVPDFEYQWRLISPQRFTGSIELVLQQKPGDTRVFKYMLPIRSEFYRGNVDIQYDRASKKMKLIHGTYTEELVPREEIAGETSVDNIQAADLSPHVVFAAQLQQGRPEELMKALDADDPIIRAAARRDLIKLDSAAIGSIEQALTDPETTYRVKVGALSVLKDASGPAKQALGEPARCVIGRAAYASNGILGDEARAAIAAGVTIPSRCANPRPASSVGLHLQEFHAWENVKGKSWNFVITINNREIFDYINQRISASEVFSDFGYSGFHPSFAAPANGFDLKVVGTSKGAPSTGVMHVIPDPKTPITLYALGPKGSFTFKFSVTPEPPLVADTAGGPLRIIETAPVKIRVR